MKQWLVGSQSIESCSEKAVCPDDSVIWFDCQFSEFEEAKDRLNSYSNYKLQELHLNEIFSNTGQPYYDSTDDYELLILSNHKVSLEDSEVLSAVVIIIFEKSIISISADKNLSDFIINARKIKNKKNISSKELLLHLLFTYLEKNLLKIRVELNNRLMALRKILLTNIISIDDWNELHKLQDMLRILALNTQQQYEVLEEWQEEESNSFIDFNVLNIHYHANQYYRGYLTIQTYETKVESLLNLHYIIQSHSSSEALKILTVIASIFLPLTFITGFFGMNFNTLPLQDVNGAAYIVAFVMGVLCLGLYVLFKKRKWL